jgi:hypothetical protein
MNETPLDRETIARVLAQAEADTLRADLARVTAERDEARADFLACAQAIGVVYQADGYADEAGPVAAVVEHIRDAVRDAARVHDWIARAEKAEEQAEANRLQVDYLTDKLAKAEAEVEALREALVYYAMIVGPLGERATAALAALPSAGKGEG